MNAVRASVLCLRSLRLQSLLVLPGAALLCVGMTACKSNSAPAPIISNNAAADPNGPDPADANMAGAQGSAVQGSNAQGRTTQVMGQSQSYTPQQQGESYPAGQQAPAPIVQGYNNNSGSNEAYSSAQGYNSGQANYDQGYSDGEAAEANTAPPPLPVYDQPPAPDPNDLWTPGYWNYAPTGYYWVPGSWVAAPYYGALWTPPYWGWYGGHYRLHHGYWGSHIGYYGGINYGFGYIGVGYYGGYWRGHDFFYNRAVNRVSPSFGNVYNRTVIVNNITYNEHPTIRTSYSGGPGGINAQPRPFEVAAEHERHVGPLPAQVALRQVAATNRGNFYAENQGRPAQMAFAHPPNAPAALPANNGGQPFNRPGAPAAAVAGLHETGNTQHGFQGAPGNAPGVGMRPSVAGNPAGAGEQGLHQHGFNQPGSPAQPLNRPAAPAANPAFNRPVEPANRPGGFNNPGVPSRPAPAANQPTVQPHVNQPGGNPGFNRPTPQANPGFNRPTPAANPGISRPVPAPAPHVEAPRAASASPPHVEAPHVAPAPTPHAAPAPTPHVEAPHAAPAPAPHVEAPHSAPAPASHPAPAPAGPRGGEGGGHPR